MSSRKKHIIFVCLSALLLIAVGGEVFLRTQLGFGNAPLYEASDEWEYMVRPNQSGKRFFARYAFNSYRQRSLEPDSSKKIILGLGDSVINGGVMTDQDSLATTILGNLMPGCQMLNISAGSWGPDNCAAYLRHYGLFGARAMFLVVSSHDSHDIMDFTPVVGRVPNYPAANYPMGWCELVGRYAVPYLLKKIKSNSPAGLDPDQKVVAQGEIRKNGVGFNPGFDLLKHMADSAGIPLTVYLHPSLVELQQRAYNNQGQEIIDWCGQNGVDLIRELDYDFCEEDYRDAIHQSASGQRKMARIAAEYYKNIGF